MRILEIPSPFPGAECLQVGETTSTMDEARVLADAGRKRGTVIVADRQTAGRGRLPGRTWESEPGANLLFTLILDGPPVAGLPLRVGLAVARAIEDHAIGLGADVARRVSVKWPNDVLVDGRKAAGTLCETRGSRVLVGLGVNCNQLAFGSADAGRLPPTSLLAAFGQAIDRFAFLGLLLVRIERALADPGWWECVERRLDSIGETVSFAVGAGDRVVEGRVLGIDGAGALALEIPGEGRRVFASGEILRMADAPGIDGTILRQ